MVEIGLHGAQHARQRQLLACAERSQARWYQPQRGEMGQRGHIVARIREIWIIQHHKAVRLIQLAERQQQIVDIPANAGEVIADVAGVDNDAHRYSFCFREIAYA